jgi:hypothetical protein
VQSILITVTAAGVLFVCGFTFSTNATMKVVDLQLKQMADNVREIQISMKSDRDRSDTNVTETRRSVNEIETRLRIVEATVFDHQPQKGRP